MLYNYFKNVFVAALLLTVVSIKGQTTILSEDFEAGTTCNTSLPSGWSTASSEWFVDASDVTCGGFVPDCTVGTGGSKLLASDGFAATEEITYGPFSTVGMGTVTIDWNGVRTNGAPVVTFSYSTDGGGTWNNIAFTDVTDDGTWYNLATSNGGSFITLPAGALGQSAVLLRWEYTCTGGNLYCGFDDVSIVGYQLGVYYYKGAGGLHLTTSWTDDPTLVGGNSPANFTSNDQTFYLENIAAVSLTAPWTVSGTGTRLFIGNGAGLNTNLTIPSGANNLTLSGGAALTVSNSSTLTLQNSTMPAASSVTLSTGSTVNYAQSVNVTVWNKAHSNITLSNADKSLPNGFSASGIMNLNGVNATMSGLAQYTLSGTITGSGSFRSAAARLTILGSGAFGTLKFITAAGTPTITQLTINRASLGNVTLGTNLGVTTFSFVNGTFNIAGRSLGVTTGVVALPTTASNGVFVGNNATTFTVGSSASAMTGSMFMDQTSSTTRSMNNITLNRATGTLTFGNPIDVWGTLLPTAGTMASGGNVTIKSSSTMKGRVGQIGASGNVTGNVTVETLAASGTTGWTTLGAAGVTGRTFADWNDEFAITCSTCPDGSTVGGVPFTSITGYDETLFAGDMDNAAHYVDIVNVTDAMGIGKGWWVYLGNGATTTTDIMIDVTGPLAMKSAFGNISLTNTGGDPNEDGWNLIANPYPSPISFTSMRNGSATMANGYWAYNPDLAGGAGDFAEYFGGVSSPAVGSGGIDDNIPTGQGFLVQVSGAMALTPVETWKSATASSNPLLKQINTAAAVGSVFRLYLNGGMSAPNGYETVFHFNSAATNGHDNDYDGLCLQSYGANIYSKMNNKQYRINGLPVISGNISIPVGVKSPSSGVFTITPIDIANLPAGACVNLYDKFTNTTHNLKTGPYIFTFADTTTVERFTLNITVNPGTLTSNVTNPTCNNTANGKIIASGTSAGPWNYVWKNNLGAIVKTTNNLAAPDTLKNLAAGIFTVEVNTVGTCDNATASLTLASTAPLPSANFSVSTPTVVLGNGFAFTNSSSNAVSYSWNFGDGNTSTTASPSYTYANAGTYNVQLTAVSACGDSSTFNTNVQVLSSPLSIASLVANENISVGKDANGVYVQMNYDKATKATVSVCNILGQQLISGRVIEGATERFYLDLNAKEQILLVTVAVDDKPTTTRVFN